MTLFIQRAEHRDTQAIHAKLDELLRTAGRETLTEVDKEEPEDIEDRRERDQAEDS
jgi:low affinity Fe/Cu permease